jgi:hypothetical protein
VDNVDYSVIDISIFVVIRLFRLFCVCLLADLPAPAVVKAESASNKVAYIILLNQLVNFVSGNPTVCMYHKTQNQKDHTCKMTIIL